MTLGIFAMMLDSFSGHLVSINLKYSLERQSFWSRNKDQLIIAIIGGIIGVVIGGIAISELSRFIK